MRILILNSVYDVRISAPEDLLSRYTTLTGWSESLLAQGAPAVSVLQLFGSDARLRRNGVEYVFYADTGTRRLRRWHRTAERFDLVHFNGLIFPWQTWWLRRTLPAGTAMVIQDHGGAEPARHPLRRIKQRIGLGAADAFLFSAPGLAQPWQNAGLIAAGQSVYAVMESSTAMRPLPRAEARAASGVRGSPAALWVGRLNANKDPLTILDGFERALPALPEARLTMVHSSDDCLSQVRARIAGSAPLTARVDLRGRIEHAQLPAFYSAADLFVLGSHREGSGYALIEALACGTAPVVTDIPSFRVLTGNGAHGALWQAGNAVDLAEALVRCGGRDLTAARAEVLEHFERELSWPVIARRALAAYTEIVSRRRMPHT